MNFATQTTTVAMACMAFACGGTSGAPSEQDSAHLTATSAENARRTPCLAAPYVAWPTTGGVGEENRLELLDKIRRRHWRSAAHGARFPPQGDTRAAATAAKSWRLHCCSWTDPIWNRPWFGTSC